MSRQEENCNFDIKGNQIIKQISEQKKLKFKNCRENKFSANL